jgi:hypothetical protein
VEKKSGGSNKDFFFGAEGTFVLTDANKEEFEQKVGRLLVGKKTSGVSQGLPDDIFLTKNSNLGKFLRALE